MKGYSVIGKRVPRTDSLAKAIGSAKYFADIMLPRMLYGKILRSPYPHAKILNIDTSKAEALPGVKAVVTGKKDTYGLPYGVSSALLDEHLLAIDKVRFVGDAVAAVAAVDEDTAEEALNLIDVDYEVLPAVFDPFKAMQDGAPQIHDQVERNISARAFMHTGNVDEGFRESDYVYEDRFTFSRISHVQMEPYGSLANFDPVGKLDIWIPSSCLFIKRTALSYLLKMPLKDVRVHECYFGGHFGGRTDSQSAELCAALLSIKTRRPVKIIYTREETMSVSKHKGNFTVDLKMGVKRDGTLVAEDARLVMDGGAFASSWVFQVWVPYVYSEARYNTPNHRYEALRICTNKASCSMQRYHGDQLLFAEEQMVDKMAKDLGMDPVEIRLKNARKTGDVLHSKSKITSFPLSETIEKAAAASGWKEKRGKLARGHGIGLACGVGMTGFHMGFRANATAIIKFNEDGSATLFTGVVDVGAGNHSMMAQVVSEELGIPMSDIALVCSDPELTPPAPGEYSMLAAFTTAEAVRRAAVDAKQQITEIAAQKLDVEPSSLELANRRVYIKIYPERWIPVANIIRSAYREGNGVVGRGSCTARAMSEVGWADPLRKKYEGQHGAAYTAGTTVAEVEVDEETGMVKVVSILPAWDCGMPINPMAVEGQWEGSTVSALGETLYEKHEWNEQTGDLITASFLDYKIPTALDAPNITPIIVETIEPEGAYGAKEAGISGSTGVRAAIASAIYDAIGVQIKENPITPEVILKALAKKSEIEKVKKV